jgi:PAS domain S-box-containing protein
MSKTDTTEQQTGSRKKTLLILYYGSDADDAEKIHAAMLRSDISCKIVPALNQDELTSALEFKRFDLIISEYFPKRSARYAALVSAQKKLPDVPLVIIGEAPSAEMAPYLQRLGAKVYISTSKIKQLPKKIEALVSPEKQTEEPPSGEGSGESEELFQAIFGESLDVIMIIDSKSGGILNVNHAVGKVLGYDPNDLFEKNFINLIASSPFPAERSFLDELASQNALFLTLDITKENGSLATMVLSATIIPWGKRKAALIILRDITEQRRAEIALRESEERFRLLAENSNDLICLHDPDCNLLYVSPSCQKLLGYEPAELLGTCLFDLSHPEDIQSVKAKLKTEILNRQSMTSTVYRVQRKDGAYIWFETLSEFVIDQDKNVNRIVTTSRDVSERKLAEEILLSSEEKYRLIVDTAREGICLLNEQKFITYVNKRLCDIIGYTAQELIGKAFTSLLSYDSTLNLNDHLDPTHSLKAYFPDTQLQSKEGTAIWTSISTNPVRSGKGELIGSLLMISNITKRKLAEEKVREQASLLDIASDAILVRDMNDTITYWNEGAERVFGWTAAEIVGKPHPLVQSINKDEYVKAKEEVLKNGTWNGEFTQQSKNGKRVIAESRWTLVRNDQGEPHSIMTVATDITNKKQIEAQFLRAQRMESIGILAGGIAHDLGNVLAPIMMSLDILKREFSSEGNRHIIETLERSAERGSKIVKQVLGFARGTEGNRGPLLVTHLVNEIMSIARQTFPKNIVVKKLTSPDLWTVLGDATQLHQILLNLCVNARDAMPNGGTLTLAVHNEMLDESYVRMNPEATVGPYVVTTVSDTGTGIPQEIIDRIFEPFFTTKAVGVGTGLGLSTTHNITKSHRGFLTVASKVGQGTSFKIYIPADPASITSDTPTTTSEIPQGNGEYILFVDDEVAVREIGSTVLKAHGYNPIVAADGTEAVALYAQQRDQIKLAVIDMVMPYLDGASTIRALRKLSPSFKVIGISGVQSHKALLEADGSQLSTFLGKPFTSEELLLAIHHAIGGGQPG